MAGLHTTTRRQHSADAQLLAAFLRWQAVYHAHGELVTKHSEVYGAHLPPIARREQEVIIRRSNAAVKRLKDIPAVTPEGIQAKATVVWIEEGWLPDAEPDDILYSLLRDLGAGAVI